MSRSSRSAPRTHQPARDRGSCAGGARGRGSAGSDGTRVVCLGWHDGRAAERLRRPGIGDHLGRRGSGAEGGTDGQRHGRVSAGDAAQVLGRGRHVPALVHVRLHHGGDGTAERPGEVHGTRRARGDRLQGGQRVGLRLVGRLPLDRGVQRRTQSPHVGRRCRVTAAGQLGREVAGGPGHEAGLGELVVGVGAGDAEVADLGGPGGRDEDVSRLDVAVDDAALVGLGQARRPRPPRWPPRGAAATGPRRGSARRGSGRRRTPSPASARRPRRRCRRPRPCARRSARQRSVPRASPGRRQQGRRAARRLA